MKKPKIELFTDLLKRYGGNLSQTADALGVSRVAVHAWINRDERFRKAVDEQRGRTLDTLVKTAVSMATGIPKIKNGKRVGWTEEPNAKVLMYLIGKLGYHEGFGDRMDVTSNGESIKPEPMVIEVIDNRDKVAAEEEENDE